jgi:hypothetical protein
MVRAGLGHAIMPWLAVHAAGISPAGFRGDDTLRLHPLRPREINLLWQAGRTTPRSSPTRSRSPSRSRDVTKDPGHLN